MWLCSGGPSTGEGLVCTYSHARSLPGTDLAMPLSVKKFVTHATCYDSLGLQEQESYLIMGQTSDLWKVRSECVGDSWCPRESGLDAPPYPCQPSVPLFLLGLSAGGLGCQGHPEWRCRLCTAQL